MTTPEGPYYMADPDEDRGFHIIKGPADFSVSMPYFLEAARLAVFLNAQHAEIQRLREANHILKDWRDTFEKCRKQDWCQEHGECCLQDGPRPFCAGGITLLASRDLPSGEEASE